MVRCHGSPICRCRWDERVGKFLHRSKRALLRADFGHADPRLTLVLIAALALKVLRYVSAFETVTSALGVDAIGH